MLLAGTVWPVSAETEPQLETAFRRMYELRFDAARAEIDTYRRLHPEDPLGAAAEAASYLFEEFDRQEVLTSSFFLDDRRLLSGIKGSPDSRRCAAFLAANLRAQKMAESRLNINPRDPEALFVVTLTDGMRGDFEALIEKHQLESLRFIRKAEDEATRLLELKPDVLDAYVAIGAANYIIGCLPLHKRVILWFGGFHGDRERGMNQLEMAANGGHYLKPLAKVLLAFAAEREQQADRAVVLFEDLSRDFPENPRFARELSVARKARDSH